MEMNYSQISPSPLLIKFYSILRQRISTFTPRCDQFLLPDYLLSPSHYHTLSEELKVAEHNLQEFLSLHDTTKCFSLERTQLQHVARPLFDLHLKSLSEPISPISKQFLYQSFLHEINDKMVHINPSDLYDEVPLKKKEKVKSKSSSSSPSSPTKSSDSSFPIITSAISIISKKEELQRRVTSLRSHLFTDAWFKFRFQQSFSLDHQLSPDQYQFLLNWITLFSSKTNNPNQHMSFYCFESSSPHWLILSPCPLNRLVIRVFFYAANEHSVATVSTKRIYFLLGLIDLSVHRGRYFDLPFFDFFSLFQKHSFHDSFPPLNQIQHHLNQCESLHLPVSLFTTIQSSMDRYCKTFYQSSQLISSNPPSIERINDFIRNYAIWTLSLNCCAFCKFTLSLKAKEEFTLLVANNTFFPSFNLYDANPIWHNDCISALIHQFIYLV